MTTKKTHHFLNLRFHPTMCDSVTHFDQLEFSSMSMEVDIFWQLIEGHLDSGWRHTYHHTRHELLTNVLSTHKHSNNATWKKQQKNNDKKQTKNIIITLTACTRVTEFIQNVNLDSAVQTLLASSIICQLNHLLLIGDLLNIHNYIDTKDSVF